MSWRIELKRAPAIGAVALMLAVCMPAFGQGPAPYVVGPNDVLAIAVFGQPQLSGKYTVEADGTFSFPLIGRVPADALSLRTIENDVAARLANGYVKEPQVTVSVDQYRSQQIFVMGEVRQPGTLQFTGTMTVLEALARVGSTTDRAGTEAIIVRRSQNGPAPDANALARAQPSETPDTIRIDLEQLQTGGLPQAILLGSGDTIFVPRAGTVFVSGQVRSPGEFPLRKVTTVRQALALAGGVTDRGSTRRIQIVRQVDGQETTEGAELEDIVQSGDTIIVRERFF